MGGLSEPGKEGFKDEQDGYAMGLTTKYYF